MALQLDLFNENFFFQNTQVCEGIAIVLKVQVTGLKVLYLSFKRVYDKNIFWDYGIFH